MSPARLQSSLLPEADPTATRAAPLMATMVRPTSEPVTFSPNHRAPTYISTVGCRAPTIVALATVVSLMAEKKKMMSAPKAMPPQNDVRRVWRLRRPPVSVKTIRTPSAPIHSRWKPSTMPLTFSAAFATGTRQPQSTTPVVAARVPASGRLTVCGRVVVMSAATLAQSPVPTERASALAAPGAGGVHGDDALGLVVAAEVGGDGQAGPPQGAAVDRPRRGRARSSTPVPRPGPRCRRRRRAAPGGPARGCRRR